MYTHSEHLHRHLVSILLGRVWVAMPRVRKTRGAAAAAQRQQEEATTAAAVATAAEDEDENGSLSDGGPSDGDRGGKGRSSRASANRGKKATPGKKKQAGNGSNGGGGAGAAGTASPGTRGKRSDAAAEAAAAAAAAASSGDVVSSKERAESGDKGDDVSSKEFENAHGVGAAGNDGRKSLTNSDNNHDIATTATSGSTTRGEGVQEDEAAAEAAAGDVEDRVESLAAAKSGRGVAATGRRVRGGRPPSADAESEKAPTSWGGNTRTTRRQKPIKYSGADDGSGDEVGVVALMFPGRSLTVCSCARAFLLCCVSLFLVAGSKNEWADFPLIFRDWPFDRVCVCTGRWASVEGSIASRVMDFRLSSLHMPSILRYVQHV